MKYKVVNRSPSVLFHVKTQRGVSFITFGDWALARFWKLAVSTLFNTRIILDYKLKYCLGKKHFVWILCATYRNFCLLNLKNLSFISWNTTAVPSHLVTFPVFMLAHCCILENFLKFVNEKTASVLKERGKLHMSNSKLLQTNKTVWHYILFTSEKRQMASISA